MTAKERNEALKRLPNELRKAVIDIEKISKAALSAWSKGEIDSGQLVDFRDLVKQAVWTNKYE